VKKHEKLTVNDSIFLFSHSVQIILSLSTAKIQTNRNVSSNLGKSHDAAVAFDEKEAQHEHQHSVATASCEQSGQF
jgi:hypothetical protein